MFSAITMNKWQLLALCACISVVTFEGAATVGVLPVYAVHLGADSATTGAFLAFNFFTIALGNTIGGWLSDRLGKRKQLLLISCAVWIPAALLMTLTTDLRGLMLTTAIMWFPGGIALAAVYSITGLAAAEGERGKVFGCLALASSLGGLLAGLISGRVADHWGFPALFIVMAAAVVVMLLIALVIEDKSVKHETHTNANAASLPERKGPGLGTIFYLLLVANLFARLGFFTSELGRPLAMTDLGFDAATVSNAIAVSSAVTFPLPLILGWLSDRIGRKRLLAVCYVAGAVGLLLLASAASPWQFWLSASLVAMVNSANGVAQAFVADLVPPAAIGRGTSQYTTVGFIAGVVGMGSTGYVMQNIGLSTTMLLGAGLLVLAVGLALSLRPPAPVTSLA